VVTTLAIFLSLVSMPWGGLSKVLHAAPVLSLFLALATIVFVLDFSAIAKNGVRIGAASLVAAALGLKAIVTAWRARRRR
jgi:hypothetical protein